MITAKSPNGKAPILAADWLAVGSTRPPMTPVMRALVFLASLVGAAVTLLAARLCLRVSDAWRGRTVQLGAWER